MKKHTNP